MAAAADLADQERTRLSRPVPAHVQGHHGLEATDRDGRCEGR